MMVEVIKKHEATVDNQEFNTWVNSERDDQCVYIDPIICEYLLQYLDDFVKTQVKHFSLPETESLMFLQES